MKIFFNSFFISFFLLILIVSCQKREGVNQDFLELSDSFYLSQKEAVEIAKKIKNKSIGSLHMDVQSSGLRERLLGSTHVIKSPGGLNSIYIVNYEEGGFVVLSADKRVGPILAFSETSSFPYGEQSLPFGLQDWIENSISHIEEVRSSETLGNYSKYNSRIDDFIRSMGDPDTSDNPTDTTCVNFFVTKSPLLTTLWGQNGGFNHYLPFLPTCTSLPTENNGRAFTGCVATALAQVVRYHEYPSSYLYIPMPAKLFNSDTTAVGHLAIANLMYDLVQYLSSNYYCDVTTAYTSDVPDVLKNVLGYSSATYTDFNWNYTKQNIDNGMPVIISAYPTVQEQLGHAWVADGYHIYYSCENAEDPEAEPYTVTKYLHMNWGWHGWYNGYFSDYWRPHSTGDLYQYGKKMVFNIYP